MAQIRRVSVRAKSKDRLTVNIEALVIAQPGVLTRAEVDALRSTLASRLMLFMANEVPFLHVQLSEIKVSR